MTIEKFDFDQTKDAIANFSQLITWFTKMIQHLVDAFKQVSNWTKKKATGTDGE